MRVPASSLHWLRRQAVATRSYAVLTRESINPRVLQAEYAVRGPLVLRSLEYTKRLANGDTSLPFDKVIPCNIGNPHILKQQPIEFHRQVLALVNVPGLVDTPEAQKLFQPDAIARAKFYLKNIPGERAPTATARVSRSCARRSRRSSSVVMATRPTRKTSTSRTVPVPPCRTRSWRSFVTRTTPFWLRFPQYPLYSRRSPSTAERLSDTILTSPRDGP
ncbi:hypothetical protein PINS_up020768 [Pythium insidiosum]|nr:hypothetical protein PINS_up020768 [Pythium insidiosum]